MEFQGRIAKVLPMRQGTSTRTGNEWYAQPFVFEYFESDFDRYADRVLLEAFSDDDIEKVQEGRECKISFYHEVREYEGRTYNNIRLHRISPVTPAQDATAAGNGGGLRL